MEKMLFTTDDVYLGGGEIALLDLMGALKKIGFGAILIIPKIGPLFYEAKTRSIDVRIIEMPLISKKLINYFLRFLKSILQLMKIFRNENISYIFANSLNAGIYASLAAKPFGARSIWYCWGYYFPKDKFWQWMYRILFDKIIFCSRFVKEKMQLHTFKGNELMVLYPGIDVNRMDGDNAYLESSFKKENKIQEDSIIFSIVGRLDPCKNHLMFLDVADEIVKHLPRSYFVIAGGDNANDGGDSRLKSELEERIKNRPSLAGRTLFTGFVRDVKKIIKSSKIIFSCSGNERFGESFGLVIVEAMVSGQPVIATSTGGPSEIIIDGVNGFLVKPGDYKAMAEKAIGLINSQSEYNKIINDARKYAIEKYTIERFARRVVDIYSYGSKG